MHKDRTCRTWFSRSGPPYSNRADTRHTTYSRKSNLFVPITSCATATTTTTTTPIVSKMAVCCHEGYDEAMYRYMTSFYANDDDTAASAAAETLFYTPLVVPNTRLTLHIWSTPVPSRPTSRLYYCSFYENGCIVKPDVDPRFARAYTFFFARAKSRRPWVECYFTRLKEITLFLSLCTLVSE